MMNALRSTLVSALLIAGSTLSGQAWAQAGFSEGAAAEALFREGAKAFEAGDMEEACDKFEASQQLDSALGTTLRLADCYDRIGKTASAWAAFQQAANMAGKQDQPEREQIAAERAEDLFERLSYLTLEVAPSTAEIEGVQVLLNDTPVPAGSWGTPIPVDPGAQVVVVRAPGYQEWTEEVDVQAEPGKQAMEVPQLIRQEDAETDASSSEQTTPYEPTAPEFSTDPSESSTQRVLAYVSGGLGVVALGASGYFAYRAYKLHDQSLEHCLAGEGNACSSRGKEIRDEARQKGDYATIAAAAGFALAGASVVLLLTEPSERGTAVDSKRLTLTAGASPAGASVEFGGTW